MRRADVALLGARLVGWLEPRPSTRFFCLSASRASASSPLLRASSARLSHVSTSAGRSSALLARAASRRRRAATTSWWPALICSSISSRLSSTSFLSSSALSSSELRLLEMTLPMRSKMPMPAPRGSESNTPDGGCSPPSLGTPSCSEATVIALRRRRRPLPLPVGAVVESRWPAGDCPATRSTTVVSVKVDGKAKKLCEDCADRAREVAEAPASPSSSESSHRRPRQAVGDGGRRL